MLLSLDAAVPAFFNARHTYLQMHASLCQCWDWLTVGGTNAVFIQEKTVQYHLHGTVSTLGCRLVFQMLDVWIFENPWRSAVSESWCGDATFRTEFVSTHTFIFSGFFHVPTTCLSPLYCYLCSVMITILINRYCTVLLYLQLFCVQTSPSEDSI